LAEITSISNLHDRGRRRFWLVKYPIAPAIPIPANIGAGSEWDWTTPWPGLGAVSCTNLICCNVQFVKFEERSALETRLIIIIENHEWSCSKPYHHEHQKMIVEV